MQSFLHILKTLGSWQPRYPGPKYLKAKLWLHYVKLFLFHFLAQLFDGQIGLDFL